MEWIADPVAAAQALGLISEWDVSAITNMRMFLKDVRNFNADINAWNVAGVTDMSYLFERAYAFNQALT